MDRPNHAETPEKDLPLRYDIRLLGRILGDTVRAQEGEPVFELVERIRRTGVQFHRDADETARQELQAIMSSLPTDRRSAPAPGCFSHLANIAEDQHHPPHPRLRCEGAAAAGTWLCSAAPGVPAFRGRNCRRSSQALAARSTAHPTEIPQELDRPRKDRPALDERDWVSSRLRLAATAAPAAP